MINVRKTRVFNDWFDSLHDYRAQARIQTRIDRVEYGNFGDAKYFDGIGELRIDYGPGYRVYFIRRSNEVVILLCGGDKSSQRSDMTRAKRLAKEAWNGT